jgi:DNA mismatch endonuclease (patch repair protein)
MQANTRRDTKPELRLRRELHAAGLRYRVDYPPLQDVRRRADVAFTRQRVAVFLDGCYWHGCPEHGPRRFGTNSDFWTDKIAANRTRDADTTSRLEAAGWVVLRFWEHDDPMVAASLVAEVVRRRRAEQGGGRESRT